MELKWYIVHTYSEFEHKVKSNLEEIIKTLCQEKYFGEILVPTEDVIELKKGKSSDQVVGQILRYIAWIKENEAKPDEKVKGLIITKEQDDKLKYSLMATENIELMNYSVSFKLQKIK